MIQDKFIPSKVTLKITTYEKIASNTWKESVTHEFHGDTIEEAHAVLTAHKLTDTFFNASFIGVFSFKGGIIYLKNSELVSST